MSRKALAIAFKAIDEDELVKELKTIAPELKEICEGKVS